MIPLRSQLSSGLNSRFTQSGLSFADYVEDMRAIIAETRLDLKPENRDKIIAANAPFELRPENYDGKRAILLVHGLFDATLSIQDLGKIFYAQGFLVRAVLLPGHGTVPGDLLDISHEEWIKATQYGIDSLYPEADEVYFGGFSTGGALGLYHALMRENLAGLFLIAPAKKLSFIAAFANHLFGITRLLTNEEKWIVRHTQDDYAKYNIFPMRSSQEVDALIARVSHLSTHHLVQIPIFMVLSHDDETINTEAALKFFTEQPHPKNRLIYYSNDALKTKDNRITVVGSRFPEQHILSFSHICLAMAPDNPHCGMNGDYHEPIFKVAKTEDETIYRGALKDKHIKHHCFQRLSYNPDFENMTQQMVEFLEIIK